jgi:single-strand DNA-binding protein
MNKVILCGNVGKDPEIKDAGSTKIVNLSVATTSRIKKGEEWVDNTQWHNVVFWGKSAEYVAKTALKGDVITVSGEINYREYTNKDGVKKNVTEIKADMNGYPSITQRKARVQNTESTSSGSNDAPPSDDLPF